MNDRGECFDCEILEGVGDAACDEIGMAGIASDDEPEGDHAVGLLALENGCHCDGNLECSGHPDEVDSSHGNEFTELVDGVLDEGIGEFLVIFGRDNTDPDLLADDPWLWLQRG